MRAKSAIIICTLFLAANAAKAQTHTGKASTSAHRTHTGPAPSLMHPASLHAKAPGVFRARFTTTKGDFVVEVIRDWAPLGADRFYNLVRYRFYNDDSLFRVLPGFVVQWGYSPKPAISQVWSKANLQDDPVKQSNLRGTITFATAGPNTRTTQVFINLADNPRLDEMGFSPFGKVVEGMDVVDKFYSGYGEGAPQGKGPDQQDIAMQGKPYLDKNYPMLDSIKTAVIESGAAAEKPATHSTTHKAATTSSRPATKETK
jgi:peptidyl-prolyl cis-trans isomerase A (cyclophilin A)